VARLLLPELLDGARFVAAHVGNVRHGAADLQGSLQILDTELSGFASDASGHAETFVNDDGTSRREATLKSRVVIASICRQQKGRDSGRDSDQMCGSHTHIDFFVTSGFGAADIGTLHMRGRIASMCGTFFWAIMDALC